MWELGQRGEIVLLVGEVAVAVPVREGAKVWVVVVNPVAVEVFVTGGSY